MGVQVPASGCHEGHELEVERRKVREDTRQKQAATRLEQGNSAKQGRAMPLGGMRGAESETLAAEHTAQDS